MSKQYKSSKGRLVDMEALRMQNEKSTAVGNMNVNSRGDKLGRGGKVVEPVNKIARAYHANNPKAIKTVSIKEDSIEDKNANSKNLEIRQNMPDDKETKKKTISKTREVELEDGSIKIVSEDDTETE